METHLIAREHDNPNIDNPVFLDNCLDLAALTEHELDQRFSLYKSATTPHQATNLDLTIEPCRELDANLDRGLIVKDDINRLFLYRLAYANLNNYCEWDAITVTSANTKEIKRILKRFNNLTEDNLKAYFNQPRRTE